MRTVIRKAFFSVICFAIFGLIAGCEEETMSSPRKERLIAAEKMALEKELRDCTAKAANLEQEIEKQKGLVVACEEEKDQLKKSSDEQVEAKFRLLFETLGKESKRLKDENAALKAQIEALQKK